MAKNSSSRRNKYLIVTSVIVFFLLVFPLSVYLLQRPQNDQQVLQAAGASVSIIDFQFSPASITVPAGTTVTWTNMSASGAMHTTSSDAQGTANSWDSGLTQKGQTFSHTFSTPGTYTYHCNVHTFMRGTIIVSAATTQPTATQVPVVPTATLVPVIPTSTPATVVPSPNCLGSCPTPTGNQQPPVTVISPTSTPIISIAPAPGTGGGNQNPLSFLLLFILLILHFLQSLL